jgi:hypothetical protein
MKFVLFIFMKFEQLIYEEKDQVARIILNPKSFKCPKYATL